MFWGGQNSETSQLQWWCRKIQGVFYHPVTTMFYNISKSQSQPSIWLLTDTDLTEIWNDLAPFLKYQGGEEMFIQPVWDLSHKSYVVWYFPYSTDTTNSLQNICFRLFHLVVRSLSLQTNQILWKFEKWDAEHWVAKHYKPQWNKHEGTPLQWRLTHPLPARLHVGGDAVELPLEFLPGFSHQLMVLSHDLGLRLRCLNLGPTRMRLICFSRQGLKLKAHII